MTGTLGRKESTFKRIINNLWILVAFIPLVNGMGIVYVGAKTSNRQWIEEGLIYEIPGILMFLTLGIINPTNYSLGMILGPVILLLVLVSIVISIIRSVMIRSKYKRMRENEKYRKSTNKLVSLFELIITCIPMLNGIPFIYQGVKYSDNRLKLEGAIYEIPWVLGLLFMNPSFFSVGFVLQIISIAKFIMLNYDSDHLSFGFGSSLRQPKPETSKSKPKDNASTEKKKPNVKTEPVKPELAVEEYGHYSNIINDINDLTAKYDEKETEVCDLVDKHFKSSEITHERFMTLINNSHEKFYSQRNSALNIIKLDSDDLSLEDKIQQKITIMKMIITKIKNLQTELILNNAEDKKADENLKDLIGDMEGLINSVKDYE